jgi:hypothetical protein
MAAIDKTQALRRTKLMLKRVWKLAEEPTSDKSLRTAPPTGLGKNDNQIRALEGPIERVDFKDVNADVIGDDLIKAKTVGELRDRIWEGIPEANRA